MFQQMQGLAPRVRAFNVWRYDETESWKP